MLRARDELLERAQRIGDAKRRESFLRNVPANARTLELAKSRRHGRVFVDTNRIAYAQTMAPAYAVRARRGAPVSAPLDWSELQGDLRPDGTTIRSVFDRLDTTGDPWHDFWRHAVSLKGPRARFEAVNVARRVP